MVLWPLGVYFLLTLIVAAAMILLPQLVGERRGSRWTAQPYESGMLPTGSARQRYSMKFYLLALFFLIFDLEAIFLFAWAISARELGWLGFVEVAIFVAVLLAALIYLWRDGALDWGTTAQLKRQAAGPGAGMVTGTDGARP